MPEKNRPRIKRAAVKTEDKKTLAGTWIKSGDGTLSIQVNGNYKLVPKSHKFYLHILSACQENDLGHALSLVDLQTALTAWESGSRLTNIDGVWHFEGKPLTVAYNRKISRLIKSAVPSAFVSMAIESIQTESQGIEHIGVYDPLDSEWSCRANYYGWPEFIRRYGATLVDESQDTKNRVLQTLVKTHHGNFRVYTLTIRGRTVSSVQIDGLPASIQDVFNRLETVNPKLANELNNLIAQATTKTESLSQAKAKRIIR